MKYLFTILILTSPALNAMEDLSRDSQPPPTLSELKAALKTLQEARLLNEQRNPPLPTLELTITLHDPDRALEALFPPKPAHSRRYYVAKPNEEGRYTIEQTELNTSRIHHTALLTSIGIDPANPIAPLITFRISKLYAAQEYFAPVKQQFITPNTSDLSLCVPYATPCILDVEIQNEENAQSDSTTSTFDIEKMQKDDSHKKLYLGILVEKIIPPDLEYEMTLIDYIEKITPFIPSKD